MYRKIYISLLLASCFALVLATLYGCANPGSGPDGGPYDETPPKIVEMYPELGATQRTDKKVSILFNELIKVENISEKVIVSPPQIEMPEIKAVGRKISVSLLDSLKPETTYTIDFSDAIVDNNEGNPFGNFTYYFSTGTQIDTMEVAGHVLSAEDLEPQKGVLVGLHKNLEDSAFVKLPFDRVARTDGNGRFCIKGVAPGNYRIYALKDMDGDFRYAPGELLAFSRDTIVPRAIADVRRDTLWRDTVHIDTVKLTPITRYAPDDVVLLSFTEKRNSRMLLKTQRDVPEWFRVYFTAPSADVPVIKGLNFDEKDAFLEQRNATGDTLTYWLRPGSLIEQDTLQMAYTYETTDDSTGLAINRTDTLELVPRLTFAKRAKQKAEELEKWEKQREKRHKRGDFSNEQPPKEYLTLGKGLAGTLSPLGNVHFSFSEPPARIDTAAFHLQLKRDSLFEDAPFRLERDSAALLDYTLYAEWRPGQEYELTIDSAAVTGLYGLENRKTTQSIHIPSEDSYGALFLIIPDVDTTAVVELLSGEKTVRRERVNARHGADFFYLNVGTYYVRLFVDANGNGRWDEGCYAEGRQAEEVFYCPMHFDVKANWDIEQTWRARELPRRQQKPKELIKQKEAGKATPKSRNAERAAAKK